MLSFLIKLPTLLLLKKSKVTPILRVNYPPVIIKNNTNNPLNLHINYPSMSLLKVKVTPKSESKLYSYNKL